MESEINVYQPNGSGRARPLHNQIPQEAPRELVAFSFQQSRDVTPSKAGLPEGGTNRRREIGGQGFGDPAPASGYGPGRIAGPVALLKSIAERWRLSEAQVAVLLGLDAADVLGARRILTGHASLRGRDQKDRVACVIAIQGVLHAVFKEPEVSYQWLTERKETLAGDSPLTRMLKGSMEDMLLTRQVVEELAGS